MKKLTYNNNLTKKLLILLIVFIVLIILILLIVLIGFTSYIYFKNYSTFIYQNELPVSPLVTKKMWIHFYGSLASFLLLIVDYDYKFNSCPYGDLITQMVALKKTDFEVFNLNFKDSDFFDSSENAKRVYMTFIDDFNRLLTHTVQFRLLIDSHIMDEVTFQYNFLVFTETYLKFLSSSITVLELAPNANDPDILDIIKKSVKFAKRLKTFS